MTIEKLIPLVLDRADAQKKVLQHWAYDQLTHTERLDKNNQVTNREDMVMLVQPGAPQEYTVVSLKGDDLPADPDQAQEQSKGQEIQRNEQTFTLRSLVDRFTVSLDGMDNSLGSPCYCVKFEPKPDQPYKTLTEKVLNHLHGHIWIDPKDYSLRQTQASLPEPVQIAWVFAEIDALNFQFDAQKLPIGYVPGQLRVEVQVTAPFFYLRQVQQSTMTHFRLRTP